MLRVAFTDDVLDALVGTDVRSDVAQGVTYRVGARVGEGGMAIAFFAWRLTLEGQCPVVLKILRPSCVRRFGDLARLSVKKEAVALGRLNEHVPPTPFVVRLLDAGTLPVEQADRCIELEWIAVEYVDGGEEGTTLTQRIAHTLTATSYAFDAKRAARAIACMAAGIAAVHEVDVVHRDLKPDNILCCGSGVTEVLKLADFGVARPVGVDATFGAVVLGTPGYAAPEMMSSDEGRIGPWTDVFAFAALVYSVLTGQEYFAASTAVEVLVQAHLPERRRLLDAPGLCPSLRADPAACESIDAVLAQATAYRPEDRPSRVAAVAVQVCAALHRQTTSSILTAPHVAAPVRRSASPPARWSWITRWVPRGERHVRSVAWEAGGSALAATTEGLAFWDGAGWRPADATGLDEPIRFVRRIAAGRWALGGGADTLAVYGTGGVEEVRRGDASFRVEDLDGDLEDLAVALSNSEEGRPELHALVGRRWLRGLALDDVSRVAAIARVEDACWLIAGRDVDGRGYLARYWPLEWHVERIATPNASAFIACDGSAELGIGLAGGSGGSVVRTSSAGPCDERLPTDAIVSAVAVDADGGGWAATGDALWRRRLDEANWSRVWSDERCVQPIISILPNGHGVVAMTADGGVLEGVAEADGASGRSR